MTQPTTHTEPTTEPVRLSTRARLALTATSVAAMTGLLVYAGIVGGIGGVVFTALSLIATALAVFSRPVLDWHRRRAAVSSSEFTGTDPLYLPETWTKK